MTRWLTETGGTRGAEYQRMLQEKQAAGEYVHGEADAVGRLLAPPARVLDGGCGTGRIAIELARRGYQVTGVDNDPSMLAEARKQAPDLDWQETDLLHLVPDEPYDLVLLAGNVMLFLEPGTEATVVDAMSERLTPGGLLVSGFRLSGEGLFTDPEDGGAAADDHALDLVTYDSYCAAVGLRLVQRWATWEGGTYAGGDYAVSVHRLPEEDQTHRSPRV